MGIPFCTSPIWAPKVMNPMNKIESETVRLVALAAGSVFLSSLACGLAIFTGLPLIPCLSLGVFGLIMMVICCLAVVKIYQDSKWAIKSSQGREMIEVDAGSMSSLLDSNAFMPLFLPSDMNITAMQRALLNDWVPDCAISVPILEDQSPEWYDRPAHSCPFQ